MSNVENSIKQVKEIVEKHNLSAYLDELIEYFLHNPPQLGHGVGHALDVALASYELGLLNKFPNPEYLFVGGLFHDIYRPSVGDESKEDQTPGADITKKILQKLNAPSELIEQIYIALKTHDSWRIEDNPPIFALLLSVGDKTAYHSRSGYGYTWSSSKLLKSIGKKMPYNTHQEAMRYFVNYQQRAWEIFTKFSGMVIGMERAVKSYLTAYQFYGEVILSDFSNVNYWDYVVSQANICHEYDKSMLQGIVKDPQKIKAILADSIELESK